MSIFNISGIKSWGSLALFALYLNLSVPSSMHFQQAAAIVLPLDEPPVTASELRYEKLMKVYVNKIKLAFSETDDQRSLEILAAYLPEFSNKSDLIIKELQAQLKPLSLPEKERLLARYRENSHSDELIALYFDKRVVSRTAVNPNLKAIMEQLHTKSLEVQQTGQKFIAAD